MCLQLIKSHSSFAFNCENMSANIVLDTGSGLIKAGFAGDDLPKCVIPTVVDGKYVIENGVTTNWDDMERLWHQTYQQLNVGSEEHPVLLTEAPLNPKEHRNKMLEIMFEKFNVPALHVSIPGVLSLYSTGGVTTGLVIDSGDSISYTVPVYEGFPMVHAIQRINLGGRDVTKLLSQTLKIDNLDVAKDIKEKICDVAVDVPNTAGPEPFELPDGSVIQIGQERFSCTEALFVPDIVEKYEMPGIPKIIYDSIINCQIDMRRDLYSNIRLSGGNTMFAGMKERILKEVKDLAPGGIKDKIHVIAPPERHYSAWIGGANFASLSTFGQCLITKAEYSA